MSADRELFKLLGKRIRLARLRRGLSAHQLGAAIGVRANTIHKYEAGLKVCRWARMQAICGALRMSPLYLFNVERRPLDVAEPSSHAVKLAMKLERLPNPLRTLLYNALGEICRTNGIADADPGVLGNGQAPRREHVATVGALAGRSGGRLVDRIGGG